MTTVLALPLLYEAVTAAFGLAAPTVTVTFGWRAPAEVESGPRLVFVPGDEDDAGAVVPPRDPGREPARPLAQLDELFTVFVSNVDETNPNDELKQYSGTRLLFDDLIATVYRYGAGTYRVESVSWHKPKGTLRIGAVLRVVFSLQAVIPDAPLNYAAVDVRGRITPTLVATDDSPAPDWVPDAPPDP